MGPLGGVLAVFLQLTGATARPVECVPADGTAGTNVWERAKAPHLRRYCDLLASGSAKLAGIPPGAGPDGARAQAGEVLAIADEAEKLVPDRIFPAILRGRALARLGRWDDALAALAAVRKKDERALGDAFALLAWARANARTGHMDEASAAYRMLLPQAKSLPPVDRSLASLEAGLVLMGRGPAAIDDAVAVLRQARRDAQDAVLGASVLALALALDRAGQKDEARGVLAERGRTDPRPLFADARVKEALANAAALAEAEALAAIGLEAVDAAAAREAWARYEKVKGPWNDHARARDPAKRKGPG